MLYGGRGGGKSYSLTVEAIKQAIRVPGLRFAVFRRSYPELYESILSNALVKLDFAGPWVPLERRRKSADLPQPVEHPVPVRRDAARCLPLPGR